MTKIKKFYVYVHTCNANGKRYVGITTQAKPEYRWKEGRGYQYNKHFYSAILKYGWNNFQHEVFEVDSESEMYYAEKYLIAYYHTTESEFGYNLSGGGECSFLGCTHSEETRKRMSEIQKKIHSNPEYIKKQSEAKMGKPHKPFGEEARKHMSEAHKGKPKSQEARKHLSETLKGKPLPRVKIKLPDGTILEITKPNLGRNYIRKGKKFEYVS